MAVNPATLAHVAYAVGNPNIVPANIADPVFSHNWNNARCATNLTAGYNNSQNINFTVDPAGDTIFLPYGQGKIHSVRLPTAGGGPTCFITAGMSGCKVFVDSINGSNDVIVYHANCIHVAGVAQNIEGAPLRHALRAQRTAARLYWTNAPNNLVLAEAGRFGRRIYGASLVAEENRKTAQHRVNVVSYGGTTVIGQLVGGHWEIYWQTYGDCTYQRPGKSPKGWFGNQIKTPANLRYRILGHGRIV